MSVSILDFTGNYLTKDMIKANDVVLILCNENCLIPNSVKANLLKEINCSELAKGVNVLRVPSDFQRGCVIGFLCTRNLQPRIFTSRREFFIGILPPAIIEFVLDTSPAQPKQVSPVKKQGKEYEDMYNDLLIKISKSILLERNLRTNKYLKLKAQSENFASGIIASLSKKTGRQFPETPQNLAAAVLEDLENQKVFQNFNGRVEYNEQLIQAYFGSFKSMIFIPGFLNHQQALRPGLERPRNQDLAQQEKVENNPRFPVFNLRQEEQKAPVYQVNHIPERFDAQPLPRINNIEPILKNTFGLTPIEKEKLDKVEKSEVTIKPLVFEKKTTLTLNTKLPDQRPKITSEGWQRCDEVLIESLTDKVLTNQNDITSLFFLYKICNNELRDYLDALGVSCEANDMQLHLKKYLKFMIDLFFTVEEGKDIDEIIENYDKNIQVKLKLKN